MFRGIPRLTPWMSWEEWQNVHTQLYSSSVNDQAEAVKRV